MQNFKRPLKEESQETNSIVLMEINDMKTDFSFSAQCNGNGITAPIKALVWKLLLSPAAFL